MFIIRMTQRKFDVANFDLYIDILAKLSMMKTESILLTCINIFR